MPVQADGWMVMVSRFRWRWSAVPALGRSTGPPGSSEEMPRRPPTVYSVQGDGYGTPTVFPQLQNLGRAHFVAALSCSGLRELALSLSSLDLIVVLPHLFPVLPDPGPGNAPLPMLLTPHVRSRQDGADLPTVTRASKPRPVAATMVTACPAPARPGIGRDQHRDRRVARVGVVGPKQVGKARRPPSRPARGGR